MTIFPLFALLILLIASTFFVGYWVGKIMGAKETFELLEKEGKIISKDELNRLIK